MAWTPAEDATRATGTAASTQMKDWPGWLAGQGRPKAYIVAFIEGRGGRGPGLIRTTQQLLVPDPGRTCYPDALRRFGGFRTHITVRASGDSPGPPVAGGYKPYGDLHAGMEILQPQANTGTSRWSYSRPGSTIRRPLRRIITPQPVNGLGPVIGVRRSRRGASSNMAAEQAARPGRTSRDGGCAQGLQTWEGAAAHTSSPDLYRVSWPTVRQHWSCGKAGFTRRPNAIARTRRGRSHGARRSGA